MRISLIHVQCLEGNNIVPPLGPMYVASALEKNGHHVQMFDVDPSVVDVSKKIAEFRPHLIGFSFLSMTHRKALDYCEALKARFPGTLFCAGGYHTTIFPEETAQQMDLDFAVIGEGEETVVEACRVLEAKGDMSEVAGLVYRSGQGQYSRTPSRPLQKNLDLFPFPARRLLPYDQYLTPPGLIRGYATERLTTMITSRGCPYSCIYCGSWQIFGRKVRRRSVENVISEIRSMVTQLGIKGLYFCDDIFVTDKEWVIGLSRQMRKEGLKIEWACQTRVDTVSDEVLREMKKAGCVQIDFGVESGSDRILRVLRKGVQSAQVEEAFQLVHKSGIRACATFMLGNPEETKEDMEQTLRLAKKIKPDYAIFYYTTPYPRTVLYDMAVQNGWIRKEKTFSEAWSHRQSDEPLMNIHYSKAELMKLRSRIQNPFFFKNYFRWGNVKFYLALLGTLLWKPALLLDMGRRIAKTGRLEVLAEGVFAEYQRRKLTGKKAPDFFAKIS